MCLCEEVHIKKVHPNDVYLSSQNPYYFSSIWYFAILLFHYSVY